MAELEYDDMTVETYVEKLVTEKPELVDYDPYPCACLGAPRELRHLYSDRGSAVPCRCALIVMAQGRLRRQLRKAAP